MLILRGGVALLWLGWPDRMGGKLILETAIQENENVVSLVGKTRDSVCSISPRPESLQIFRVREWN